MKLRNNSALRAGVTLVLGLAALGLRLALYRVGVDEKGLLTPGHPLEIGAWIVTAAAAALAVLPGKEPPENRQRFLKWLYEFEYDHLGLPRPDLTLYLDVPTDFTEKLLRAREQDTHTKADIHEKDTQYLATCRRMGAFAADYYGWTVISCVRDGKMRSMEDIHEEIYRHVRNCLED